MKLTEKQVHEIAQELEAGMKVFINRDNLEIKSILDWDVMYGADEFWDEELEEIENKWENYLVLEKMSSNEAFSIMEDFIEEVDDEILQKDLFKILSRKSPFANFKDEVDSSDYRQRWFEFRQKKYEEYVREQLDLDNTEYE